MPPDFDDQSSRLGPEAIARMTFPTSFRGYDPEHVRGFLESIAMELREAHDHEIALELALEAAESRAESIQQPDETQLTELLGEETVRVLLAAREAAAEIRSKGEDSVARLLREAQDEVTRMKADAEEILDKRTKEAEVAAEAIRTGAEAQAEAIKAQAEAAAAALRAEGEAAVADARLEGDRIRGEARAEAEQINEAAKAHGREMVEEALLVRTRVLEDLSRKRKAARVQLERLQAGRERLLESYDIVRRTLDDATEELRGSLTAAKHAADVAARRVEAEPAATVEQLDAEVTAARDAGLPLVEPEVDDTPFDEELPEGEMVAIEPSAEFEEVRVVAEQSVIEPEPEPEPVAVEPEPEPAAEEPEPVAEEPEPAAEEPEPEPELVVIVEEIEATEEVVVVVEEAPAEETEATAVDVDDLFARIRAARAQEVAKAHEVLGEAPSETPEPSEPTPGPAATTVEDASSDESDDESDEYEPVPATPDDQALLERRDAVTDAAERDAIRKLRRVLADEQNEVLDRLRRNASATLDDLLPDQDDHALRWAEAAAPALADAATGGARFYGTSGSAVSVDNLAIELGQGLTLPLRERIGASLRESAGDDDALADGIRAAYRDWKTHRIEMQARDMVFAAFNRGLYEATESGTSMRWLVDDGGSPCPDAEDNSLAGLVVHGEAYPTGHCYPPAHPGCRCLLVPATH